MLEIVMVVAALVLVGVAAAVVVTGHRGDRKARRVQQWPTGRHRQVQGDRMSEDITPRPAELELATMCELAEGYSNHTTALVNAEQGMGEREPAGRLRGSALSALAIGQALSRKVWNGCWATVRDALKYGASVADVATALDMEPADVIAGMTEWANSQHVSGAMSAEEHADVFALLRGASYPAQ